MQGLVSYTGIMDAIGSERRETLQAKKQDVVRREIWNAAIELFHEQGFDEVTVEQIASHAGVSYRTFFRYFSSKDDVMASTTKSYGTALVQAIAAEGPAVSRLDVAKSAIKKVLVPDPLVTERVLKIAERSRAARVAQFLEVPILEREIAAAFARREGDEAKAGMDERVLASLALSATGISAETWVAQQHRPIDEIIDEVFGAITAVCVDEKLVRAKPLRSAPLLRKR